VCFTPRGQHAAFVARRAGQVPARAGTIVDDSGRVLGRHDGVHQFTIGQRRGLRVSAGQALYVTRIDARTGTVRVGPPAGVLAAGLVAHRPNWLSGQPVAVGAALQIKIRSRFAPTEVTLSESTPQRFVAWASDGLRAVTPGQAAVLYDRGRVVGGGWIERALAAG
jgi:tRNA-specific 2-thiouridylase